MKSYLQIRKFFCRVHHCLVTAAIFNFVMFFFRLYQTWPEFRPKTSSCLTSLTCFQWTRTCWMRSTWEAWVPWSNTSQWVNLHLFKQTPLTGKEYKTNINLVGLNMYSMLKKETTQVQHFFASFKVRKQSLLNFPSTTILLREPKETGFPLHQFFFTKYS